MTKVVFIDFSCNIYDKHHVYTIAGYLRGKGIDVGYINESDFSKTLDRLRELTPDLLLYSAFSADADIYFKFDAFIKKHLKVRSIMGGAGPTFDNALAKRGTIDAFCVGEGEYALEEYIDNGFEGGRNIMPAGAEAPVSFHPLVDLDSVPIPDRGLVYEQDAVLRAMPSKQFMAGRGCPYNCTYCYNNIFNKVFKGCGPIVRFKSVDYLIEEIRQVRKHYPLENVVFHDDTFISNRKWFMEFAGRFPREIGLNYSCLVRANLLDEELVRALKESGCISANWSIECGNDRIRNEVLKRNMSRDKILEAGSLLHRFGIRQKVGNMVGLPGETFDNMLETVELNIEVRPQFCLATIFTPFPGLELTRYAIEHGHLDPSALEKLPGNYFTRSTLNFSPEEKVRIQKLSWLFQVFVDYPALYRDKKIFNFLFCIPGILLRIFFEVYTMLKFSRQYRIKTPFHVSLRIFLRQLKDSLGLHRPDNIKETQP